MSKRICDIKKLDIILLDNCEVAIVLDVDETNGGKNDGTIAYSYCPLNQVVHEKGEWNQPATELYYLYDGARELYFVLNGADSKETQNAWVGSKEAAEKMLKLWDSHDQYEIQPA